MSDDWQLLRAYVESGSAPAFAELVQRYASLVYGCALRQTGDAHAAEDVSQAVFMVLARKAKSIGAEAPLGGWLFNVARYTASNYRRIEARRRRRERYVATMKSEEQVAPSESELGVLLDDALAALSHNERDVVILRFFQDKSLREIGESLGISEDAAAQRFSRALRRMREWMSRQKVSVEEAALTALLPLELCRAAPAGLAATLAKTALAPPIVSTLAAALSQKMIRRLAWEKMRIGLAVMVAGTAVGGIVLVPRVLPRISHAAPAPAPPMRAGIVRSFTHPGTAVIASALSADGRRALTAGGVNLFPAANTEIRLWDLESGKELSQMRGHGGRVTGVAFAAGERRAVSASLDGTARLWNLASGQQLQQLDAHLPIGALAVSPDGTLAAVGARRLTGKEYASIHDTTAPTLRLWDLSDSHDTHRFDSIRQGVGRVAFAPDGRHLAAGFDGGRVSIWDLQQSAPLTMATGAQFIRSIVFSPDSAQLFAATDSGELYIWNTADGTRVAQRHLQDSEVLALAISPDGKQLISAGGTARVLSPRVTEWTDCLLHAWDVQTGQSTGNFSGHSTGVYSLGFSADGQRLISAGGQRVCVWEVGKR